MSLHYTSLLVFEKINSDWRRIMFCLLLDSTLWWQAKMGYSLLAWKGNISGKNNPLCLLSFLEKKSLCKAIFNLVTTKYAIALGWNGSRGDLRCWIGWLSWRSACSTSRSTRTWVTNVFVQLSWRYHIFYLITLRERLRKSWFKL